MNQRKRQEADQPMNQTTNKWIQSTREKENIIAKGKNVRVIGKRHKISFSEG